jgi:hypothetical protein
LAIGTKTHAELRAIETPTSDVVNLKRREGVLYLVRAAKSAMVRRGPQLEITEKIPRQTGAFRSLVWQEASRSIRVGFDLARCLARHPREIRRLPQWLSERSLSPMAIRRPWWPYDATIWIAEHMPNGARVFEFGGGGSTLWLQDQGAEVIAVEHHEDWVQQLVAVLAPSARVMKRGTSASGSITSAVEPGFFDEYVAAVGDEPDSSLDLVIVDGRARVECVRQAMSKVKPGGLLLLDDSDRARYRPAVRLLIGWERHIFRGLKPGDYWSAETSVWRRPGA